MLVNRFIRKSVICSYANIFRFLDVLKNAQTDVYIKMRNSNQTRKRLMDVEKDDNIHEIMRQYEDKIIIRLDFIEKSAYNKLPVSFLFNILIFFLWF